MHGGQPAVRAGTIVGPCCTVRGSRGMVSCSLATHRSVKHSRSLIASIGRLVRPARSAVRVDQRVACVTRPRVRAGRVACSRRRTRWPTTNVTVCKRSLTRLEEAFPVVRACASAAHEARPSGPGVGIGWTQQSVALARSRGHLVAFHDSEQFLSLWSLYTSRSGWQNAHIVP